MNRTLIFCMVLRKLTEITKNERIFSQYNIFYNYEYFYFQCPSIIAKAVNQIRNNVVCVAARLVFLFCLALSTGRCNAFQHNFVNSKKSEFYGPYFQTMLFLATIIYDRDLYDIWPIFYMIGTFVMKEFTEIWEILSTL